MSFRRPEQDRGSSSLGYRISSNRQPGVEIANNRMPSRPIPRQFSPEDLPLPMPFPRPGEGRPAPMPRPMPMPTPKQMEPFRPPPDMFPRLPDKFKDYLDRNLMPRERQGISPDKFRDYLGPDKFRDYLDRGLMPRERQGIEELMPYEDAAVDPSDYRTILKMIEAGLDPDDYMSAYRGGIASLMR
jgi:hypothetical protein|tara:strand:+ start:45 stop:602 length:558 start_codon:yes stop_codon:yes gene_type:complete